MDVPSLLVVEPRSDAKDTLTKWLVENGYTTTSVWHPRQALEAATIRSFDVAILDAELPEMTGLQLANRLKALAFDLRVVLLSSQPDKPSVIEALSFGVDGLVQLPCHPREIEFAVNRVLDQGDRVRGRTHLARLGHGTAPTTDAMDSLHAAAQR